MEQKKEAKAQYVIIDSINKTKGKGEKKKIVLEVKAKDLPEGVKKDDLVAAFKVNAEKEEEKNAGKEKKYSAKFLIPIVITLTVLLGMVKGCVGNKPVIDVRDLNALLYKTESPYVYMEGVTNADGQEGMTANILNGQYAMDGDYYDSSKQFENEEKSSVGQEEFEQMEEELQGYMETLISPEASQQEKNEAAKKALEINQKIEGIYVQNLEFVEARGESFEESAMAFEDSHTEDEIKVIRATIDEYKENMGLSSSNVEALRQIVELVDNGYSIDISGNVISERGDYIISGKAVKEVAEEVGYDKKTEKTLNNFMGNESQEITNEKIGGENGAR